MKLLLFEMFLVATIAYGMADIALVTWRQREFINPHWAWYSIDRNR